MYTLPCSFGQNLPLALKATVITHSPTIAAALLEHEELDVIIIGAKLFKHSAVTVGATALEAISRMRADTYFRGSSVSDETVSAFKDKARLSKECSENRGEIREK